MSKSRLIAWMVWIIASIFYAYQYILRVMPNIMMNDILTQFNIDTVIFGQWAGIYYLGYSLMHLPIGIMLDRYGPKKVIPICIIITSIGMMPIIFASSWIYPVIGRLLIGIGSSAAILGVFKIIHMNFAAKKFTQMLSISVTIGLIGAIYGGAPLNYMMENMGYKNMIIILSSIGIILAFTSYLLIPAINPHEQEKTSVWADIKQVITNPKVLIICILSGLMVGPLEGFADAWGTRFLQTVYQFDEEIASALPSMIFIGMCFGAPVLSFIAHKTSNIGTIIISGILMALIFYLLLFNAFGPTTMTIAFIIVGICSSYQIIAIYIASTYVPKRVTGLTSAVANMIIMLFGNPFHTIIGTSIDLLGGINNSTAFCQGIAVIPIATSIAVIGFALMMLHDRKTSYINNK